MDDMRTRRQLGLGSILGLAAMRSRRLLCLSSMLGSEVNLFGLTEVED
jgi:hypothetical protein